MTIPRSNHEEVGFLQQVDIIDYELCFFINLLCVDKWQARYKNLSLRDLRYGDPLSPYLFILCAKGLSSLLNNSDLTGEIRGVIVVRGGTRINHLLFANDCLFFGRAKVEEWLKMQHMLLRYDKTYG